MVKYKCNNCLKEFKQKCHYVNHVEKKKYPCQPILLVNPDKIPTVEKIDPDKMT